MARDFRVNYVWPPSGINRGHSSLKQPMPQLVRQCTHSIYAVREYYPPHQWIVGTRVLESISSLGTRALPRTPAVQDFSQCHGKGGTDADKRAVCRSTVTWAFDIRFAMATFFEFIAPLSHHILYHNILLHPMLPSFDKARAVARRGTFHAQAHRSYRLKCQSEF